MKVEIKIILKDEILDPQGKAVLRVIEDLEFKNVKDVKIGKYIELTFDNIDQSLVEKETKEICQKLLVNPVMEKFSYEII